MSQDIIIWKDAVMADSSCVRWLQNQGSFQACLQKLCYCVFLPRAPAVISLWSTAGNWQILIFSPIWVWLQVMTQVSWSCSKSCQSKNEEIFLHFQRDYQQMALPGSAFYCQPCTAACSLLYSHLAESLSLNCLAEWCCDQSLCRLVIQETIQSFFGGEKTP